METMQWRRVEEILNNDELMAAIQQQQIADACQPLAGLSNQELLRLIATSNAMLREIQGTIASATQLLHERQPAC